MKYWILYKHYIPLPLALASFSEDIVDVWIMEMFELLPLKRIKILPAQWKDESKKVGNEMIQIHWSIFYIENGHKKYNKKSRYTGFVKTGKPAPSP